MFSAIRRILCTGTVATLALTTAACSGDESSGGDATPSIRTLGGAPASMPLTSDQLKRALLTPADLPPGYRADPEPPDPSDRPIYLVGDLACSRMVELTDQLDLGNSPGAVGHAVATLAKGNKGRFVEESLVSYPAGEAEKVYAELSKAAAACKKFALDVGGGAQAQFRQAPTMDSVTFGDASQVNRFVGILPDAPIHTDQLVILKGGALLSIDLTAYGPLKASEIQQIGQKAVAKLGLPS